MTIPLVLYINLFSNLRGVGFVSVCALLGRWVLVFCLFVFMKGRDVMSPMA